MLESIINSSELEIPCRFILQTVFVFYLIDDNHVWEPLKDYISSDRKSIEEWYEKLNSFLKSKSSIKINNKDYPTERLYTSKIEQRSRYRLIVKNQEVPLHKCVNVIIDRVIENTLIIDTVETCQMIGSLASCDDIDSDECFEEETLCYDSNKNNFY